MKKTSSETGVVYHDYFAIRGGGERLVLTLANAFHFDLKCGYLTESSYDNEQFETDVESLELTPVLRRFGIRPIALSMLFSRQKKKAAQYRLRIFSGVAAPFAAPEASRGLNVFYCHTPPRFLYDQRVHFLSRLPFAVRIFAAPVLRLFERRYRAAVTRMHVVVANSETTRLRISKFLGVESVVINPPVETSSFVWQPPQGYYLSTARLSPLKRVDLIVEAFRKMPDKRLIVVSGGEELKRLRELAAGATNIEFLGWVNDDLLFRLISEAIATIYLPKDEDFGMSPVESMAAGKPVIGVAEGGLLETIIDGETGLLLPPRFEIEDIVKAVNSLSEERALQMRDRCIQRSQDFTREKFLARMAEVLSIDAYSSK
ncbi:glycosyltransferase [Rhizobium sp. L1K21]|uniref:glycosyltransferase n=1 Tax=Rhizobium sp. L1K21 TaxID=2954933 RepID=UPI002092CB44|nr:glycosyltransferase [Rhizobium sp. L1K21]MCO6187961.1 glycosyltransferase [Rhizobium sp. L1K21]